MIEITLEQVWDWIPSLTKTEAKILQALQQANDWVSRDKVKFAGSGRVHSSYALASVHICRIRKKLPATHEIETNHGRGYRLVEKANG